MNFLMELTHLRMGILNNGLRADTLKQKTILFLFKIIVNKSLKNKVKINFYLFKKSLFDSKR